MATTCNISSTFDIYIVGTANNVAKVFTAPRNFKVIGCTVFNEAAATATLTLTGSTAGVFSATTAAPPIAGAAAIGDNSGATDGGPTQNAAILDSASNIVLGETITVLASAATVSRVILHCVATDGGQALTIA